MVITEIPPPPPVSHAHHPPPPAVLALHKKYIKIPIEQLANDPYILDLDNISDYHKTRLQPISKLDKDRLLLDYKTFLGGEAVADPDNIRTTVYTHKNVPGRNSRGSRELHSDRTIQAFKYYPLCLRKCRPRCSTVFF